MKNASVGFRLTIWRATPEGSKTEFTLHLLPLGGFLALPEHTGVDKGRGDETVEDDPDLLENRQLRDGAVVGMFLWRSCQPSGGGLWWTKHLCWFGPPSSSR